MTQTRFEKHRAQMRTPVGLAYVTIREAQAIELYMTGETPMTISPLMNIDYRSVEALMRNARDRTGARTNCQLVAMYVTRNRIGERGRPSNQESNAAAGHQS